MPWTAAYDPESDFVLTVYEGRMTAEDLVAEEEQTFALAIKNGTNSFLVDLMNYEGSISPSNLFGCPARYEKKLERPIYVAVVEPVCEKAREDARFYETVCRNRGWTVTIFKKKNEAVAWLEEMKED